MGLKETQCQMILEYLDTHESINFHNALDMGITRLASRICDLKKKGYMIKRDVIQDYDEDGNHICYHVEYSFLKED